MIANLSGEVRNRLLSALSPRAQILLAPDLEFLALAAGYVLYEPTEAIDFVYFPETAVASMVRRMADGSGVEVGTIGREGVVGGSVALGAVTTPTLCVIQVAGSVQRISTAALRAAVALPRDDDDNGNPSLNALMLLYAQALFEQCAQTAACNRLHALEHRCARWILMIHDRVDGDELLLTQEFLSYMLGVRRAGVTEACGTLMRAGLIRYRHGRITVTDRGGLEAASCECFQVAVDAYDELFGTSLVGSV
ncbi:MAG: Crp/Fnr family transcriptional regulator [Gemmatimonadetes bacterium]|jgi:CRP-like cAMP-binding protein|nr:Crp/Fnr family transcriptional regulator [Gemmatimonadota bacterium]